MWTKLQIERGIEWICKDAKIDLKKAGDFIDIALEPSYRSRRQKVVLYLQLGAEEVKVVDLIKRSGDSGGIWGRGYGTLLFNTGITILKLLYDTDPCVTATIKNKGSSEDEISRRNHFWKSFGFTFDPQETNPEASAQLSQLRIKERTAGNGLPAEIPLSAFWRRIHRPIISRELFDTLGEIDLDSIAKEPLNPPLRPLIWSFLKSKKASHAEQDGILSAKGFIAEIETETNGFAWQLYEALSDAHPQLSSKIFKSLAEKSKINRVDWLVSRQDDYLDFIRTVKSLANINNRIMLATADRPAFEKIDDFFFGELNGKIAMIDLAEYAKILSAEQFTAQIHRILMKLPGNYLAIMDDTSYTHGFEEIIDKINDIHMIELYHYGDKDSEMCFLRAKLYLLGGVLDFKVNWCAWKELRAGELFQNMRAIYQKKLLERTYYLDEKGLRFFVPQNEKDFVLEVLDLIMERNYSEKRIADFIAILTKQDIEQGGHARKPLPLNKA